MDGGTAGKAQDLSFFREKYIKGLEEKLELHNQIQERDAHIRRLEREVADLKSQVETLQKQKQTLQASVKNTGSQGLRQSELSDKLQKLKDVVESESPPRRQTKEVVQELSTSDDSGTMEPSVQVITESEEEALKLRKIKDFLAKEEEDAIALDSPSSEEDNSEVDESFQLSDVDEEVLKSEEESTEPSVQEISQGVKSSARLSPVVEKKRLQLKRERSPVSQRGSPRRKKERQSNSSERGNPYLFFEIFATNFSNQ